MKEISRETLFLKKISLTTILSDGEPFYNGFGALSKDVYCKTEILVETPDGIKGESLK